MSSTGFKEQALPSKLDFSVWLKISRYAFRYWPLLLVALLCTLFATFYDSSFTPVMNAVAISVSEQIGKGLVDVSSIWDLPMDVSFLFGIEGHFSFAFYCVLLGIFIVLRSFAMFGSIYSLNLVSMHIVIDLRRDTFAKIQEMSFSFFDTNSAGWLIARMQGDTSAISDALAWSINSILWSVFQIILAITTMFSLDWRYSLIVLASIPLVAVVAPILQLQILKAHRIARNATSVFVGHLSESIDGAKTIKSMSLEKQRTQEEKEITSDLRIKRYRAHCLNAFVSPFLSLVSGTMIAIVVFYGNHQIAQGLSHVATIVLFISFVSEIYDPLQSLAETATDFLSAQAGAEKVMQLLQAKPEIVDSPEVIERYGTLFNPKKEAYEPFHGHIEFRDIRFRYREGPEVLHGLNLSIAPGTSIGVVGETGSGKTTLVNLLCRFYEPTSGEIRLDGVDYRARSLGWLRSQIGYVQQTPFVFKGTYFENIAYGKEEATEEEVRQAAKRVGMDAFILSQPQGYQTLLTAGGDSLSQGQKQLLSFARALLRNPPLLILDEATSSVDTLTEMEIQSTVEKLLKGRTSICIAHRLSTVMHSDRILFLEGGKIVEEGTHEELMEKRGKYYELFLSQFRESGIDAQMKWVEKEEEKKR